jgi:hypothetical protein
MFTIAIPLTSLLLLAIAAVVGWYAYHTIDPSKKHDRIFAWVIAGALVVLAVVTGSTPSSQAAPQASTATSSPTTYSQKHVVVTDFVKADNGYWMMKENGTANVYVCISMKSSVNGVTVDCETTAQQLATAQRTNKDAKANLTLVVTDDKSAGLIAGIMSVDSIS